MITLIPYNTLGHANFGWLNARYHFSFGKYYNPNRMGFGTLRVINDDIIAPHSGFDPHPHRDMEIITFVRSGAITHGDSKGNQGRTEAGDVQVMSAGKGITHSEYNREDIQTTLYQIWIEPRAKGLAPRWDSAAFDNKESGDTLSLLVSGYDEDQKDGVLYIHQDATIHAGNLRAGANLLHPIRKQAYILISEGEISVNGQRAAKGDGVSVTDEKQINIAASTQSQIIVIDAP